MSWTSMFDKAEQTSKNVFMYILKMLVYCHLTDPCSKGANSKYFLNV